MAIKLETISVLINKRLKIKYCIDLEQWHAEFHGAEVMENGCLGSICGRGNTPNDALANYARLIAGKRLAFGAYTLARQEFDIPKEVV